MYIKDMKFVNICQMTLVGGIWNWVLICILQNNGRVHYLLLVFSIDFLIELFGDHNNVIVTECVHIDHIHQGTDFLFTDSYLMTSHQSSQPSHHILVGKITSLTHSKRVQEPSRWHATSHQQLTIQYSSGITSPPISDFDRLLTIQPCSIYFSIQDMTIVLLYLIPIVLKFWL